MYFVESRLTLWQRHHAHATATIQAVREAYTPVLRSLDATIASQLTSQVAVSAMFGGIGEKGSELLSAIGDGIIALQKQ